MEESGHFPSAPAGATCDACAEGDKHCTIQDDCYICDDCTEFYERAVIAAAKAVCEANGWPPVEYAKFMPDAQAAINAYCEFTDE